MKRLFKSFIVIIIAICLSLSFTAPLVFADDEADDNKNIESCVCDDGKKGTRPKTNIIGRGQQGYTGCECGDGESITSILKFVVDIMSVGIGILGVIGISITGIQYLTAGGNEEQVRKAKRRMFEIIIGLAVYAVVAALLSWLLPNFGKS